METTTEKRIKTGGRKKGTPNKITASMKYMFKALIMNNYDIVEDAFMKAKPKEQLNFIAKIAPYLCAKEAPNEQGGEWRIGEDMSTQWCQQFEVDAFVRRKQRNEAYLNGSVNAFRQTKMEQWSKIREMIASCRYNGMDSDRIEQIMEDEIASFIKQSHEDEARLRASFEELRERYNESEPDFGYEEIDEEQHEETEEETKVETEEEINEETEGGEEQNIQNETDIYTTLPNNNPSEEKRNDGTPHIQLPSPSLNSSTLEKEQPGSQPLNPSNSENEQPEETSLNISTLENEQSENPSLNSSTLENGKPQSTPLKPSNSDNLRTEAIPLKPSTLETETKKITNNTPSYKIYKVNFPRKRRS